MTFRSGMKVRTLTAPIKIGYVMEYEGKMVNIRCLDGTFCSVDKKLVRPYKRIKA